MSTHTNDRFQDIVIAEYWQKKLAAAVPVPVSNRDAAGTSVAALQLDETLAARIRTLCQGNGLAEFTYLLSFYLLLLEKYNGQPTTVATGDVRHGDAVTAPDHLLFFSTGTSGSWSVREWLGEVKKDLVEVLRHRAFDYKTLSADLQNRNIKTDELAQFSFAYNKVNESSIQLALSRLSLRVEEEGAGFRLALSFDNTIYSEALGDQILRSYAWLLEQAVSNPDAAAASLSLLPPDAQKALLSRTGSVMPTQWEGKTIVQVFEETAALYPDEIALVSGSNQWTYRQLNEKANQVAHYFKTNYDIQPEEPIGLMVHSTDWLVVGMLSILKSGGCFVPVEAGLPAQRKAHIFNDAALRTIITEFDLMTSLGSFSGNLFFIDFQADTLDTSTENPGLPVQPENVAYIIYTSGTTGMPKGVMIEHRSLVNYADWFIHQFNIGANDSALLTSSYAFDLGYTNIWGALLSGAELHLVDLDLKRSAAEILSYLVEKKISFIKTTPSFFYMLLHQPQFQKLAPQLQIRLILLGGEPLHINDVLEYWEKHPDTTMVNHYGPTETTIGSVFHVLSKERIDDYRHATVIGNEVLASQAYVLDEASNLVPPGVAGELGLSGAGVARGYLNQPELTFDKFIAHPFVGGAKLYRTGDIAKRNIETNTIILSGRRDAQVKIRGYRVELGEIAVALKRHASVNQALALVKSDEQGNPSLVAYYTGTSMELAQLRSFLTDYLPDYMIPAQAVFLNAFPITANGKVDTKALPEPQSAKNSNYEAPVTAVQKQLAGLWQQVLNVKQVGLKDQFFDLGGHSLKATQLLTEIHRQLQARIGLNDIFDYPVLRDMADLIERTAKTEERVMPTAEEQEYYELSFAQRRLWLIEQFDEAGGAYNVHNSFSVTGLDRAAFNSAIQALLQRHEIMRTSFVVVEGEPRQKIHRVEELALPVKYVDLRNEQDKTAALAATVREEKRRAFQLSEAPLFRVTVLQLDEEQYQVEMNIHHIIHDGWSKEVLVADFTKLHAHFAEGSEAPAPLNVQYKDYVAVQQWSRSEGLWDEHRAYWQKQFGSGAPVLELPTDYARPLMKQYKGAGLTFLLEEENTQALTALCQEQKATLFMGLLSLVKLLLHRYTGQDDLVIGTPVAGRDRAELKDQLGFYVNTLALRTSPDAGKGFRDLLKQVRDTTVQGYAHQDYPFDLLVDELPVGRDMSRTPLFDVMVLLQNIGEPLAYHADMDGAVDGPVTMGENSKFDLTFMFQETSKGVLAHLTYNVDLYSETRMRGMVRHLKNLLVAVKENADRPLASLSYLDVAERTALLEGFAGTEAGYDESQTIVSIFEQRATEYPDHIAVTNGDESLSYAELNEKANQLAHYLIDECGLQQDTLVGLMASRSAWTVMAMLAILKAGGAYVPIDPDYPQERKNYILEDSAIKFLLAEEKESTAWMDASNEIVIIHPNENINQKSTSNPTLVSNPRNLAYVIYTSGSSGKPKGVLIEHYNVVRLLFNEANKFDFRETDVWSLFHSMCFDFSVWEIYGALLYGGRLVMVPSTTAKDPQAFAHLLIDEGVTVLNQVPGVFHLVSTALLAQEEKPALSIRYVIFGGEALNPASLKAWHKQYPGVRLINMYGITETTVHTTYKEIGEAQIEAGDSNIGIALPTVSLYLTGSEGDLVAQGLTGELLVGGKGLARGYLNRPALTSERFINNPWGEGHLYRSGDLARQTTGGEFVYLGRSDFQVKIRGHRIELGEIEDALLRYEGIGNAVVAAKGKGTEVYLVAYYAGKKSEAAGLRGWLMQNLPAYMMPSVFVHLEEGFVLTGNGKIDRKQLPEPQEKEEIYTAPETLYERQLAAIWEKTLNRKKLSVTADFFESGGNSISAARLVGYMDKELRIRINLRTIFDAPSIRQLAKVVEEMRLAEAAQDEELIPFQKYMWMLENVEGNTAVRNVYASFDTDKNLDAPRLRTAARQLQERHPLLRAQIVTTAGVPKQRVTNQYAPVESIDLRGLIASVAGDRLSALLQQNFTIEEKPLFRVLLVQYNNSCTVVLLAHAMILDAPSMRVLLDELLSLYHEPGNNEKQDARQSIAEIWNSHLAATGDPSANEGWNTLREEGAPAITFFGDQQSAASGYRQATQTTAFSTETTQALNSIGQSTQTNLFDLLVSGLNVLVSRYTGLSEFIFATPVSSTSWKGNENTPVGPYEYQLPLFQQVKDEDSLNDVLARTSAQLAHAKANAYPFEEWLSQQGSAQNWKFDLAVSFDDSETSSGFIASGATTNSTDLLFHFYQKDGQLWLRLEYNATAFSKERAASLSKHAQEIITSFATDATQSVASVSYISTEEKTALTATSTSPEQPAGAHIVDVFAARVAASPDSTAAMWKTETLTYRALDRQSDRLAAYLTHEKGIQDGALVGVYLQRSFSSLVTLLGILKAGGAYLPIDTAFPPSRIKELMDDSGATLLLTDESLEAQLQELRNETTAWSIVSISEALAYSNVSYSATILPSQLAYCIYTSGSTGRPKGVLIEHGQLIHTLHAEQLLHGLDERMVSCASTNYTFDVSLLELLLPLYAGGSVALPEDDKLLEEGYLPRFLATYGVTDLQGTPTFISSFLVQALANQNLSIQLPQLQRLWIGGESLNESLVKNLRNLLPQAQINNHYGPTEITIDCIARKDVRQFDRNSIGRPLAHAYVYILDKNLALLPAGAIGEICIGGKTVARGYLHNEELNREKFVADPFNQSGRLYRTGDYGFFAEDGQIIFIGRRDRQVKIRGHRIETGEVEQALLRHHGIRQGIIIPQTNASGEKELVAYVIPEKGKSIELWPSMGEYPVYDELMYQSMAEDKARNALYREAINQLVPGKTVLEIGPGAELVLTLMCVEAGAEKIYAIEWSEASYKKALAKLQALGLEDKIILMYGNALEVTLPESVDVYVSEQLGAIASSENAIRLNNHALKQLKQGGTVIPRRATTRLGAIELPAQAAVSSFGAVPYYYVSKIFDSIGYSFDLRVLLKNSDESVLLSNEAEVEDLDFSQTLPEENEQSVALSITRDGTLSGLLAWVTMQAGEKGMVDALREELNWLPLYLPVFEEPVAVRAGDVIHARFSRSLSADGYHPDYRVSGRLERAGAETIEFDFTSFYAQPVQGQNRFYRELFAGGLEDQSPSMEETVRAFLQQQLPSYMVPAAIVEIDSFPLTSSGKIDQKALQQLRSNEKAAARSFVAPADETEQTLSAIWCEALNLDAVSVTDNFFDLGGHSIRAARIAALVSQEFGIKISLKAIFDQPTVRGMAALVKEKEPARARVITAVEEQEHYPVSHAQKRMWILDQVEREGISAYNMPFVWEMEGLDVSLVQQTFDQLMQRHESLRTTFVTVEGAPRQRVWPVPEAGFRVQYIDLRNDEGRQATARRLVDAENLKPFDLEKGPLLRASILQIEDDRQLFLLTLQHTVGDAWSMEVFENDFKTIYNALLNGEEANLSPLDIQYKDYAVAQHCQLEEGRGQRDADYWMEQFKTEPPVLELAADKVRPVVKTYNGSIIGVMLDPSYSRRLYDLSQQMQVSVTMILMASVKALLYKYSGHDDITVGCPIIGRDTVELEQQIGFYANTLAIRTAFNPEEGFKKLVYGVRENILNAFDHQLYPFDKLVEDLDMHRDLSRSPLFDVMVIHHNVGTGKKQSEMKGVEINKFLKTVQQSKFDLTFNFSDAGDQLLFSVNYNSDIYTEARVKQIMAHFETLLSSALANVEIPVHTLGYLTPAEQKQLMVRFNQTVTPYPQGQMIHEIIERQAARLPESTALVCDNRYLSFREVNERANRLAHFLRSRYNVKGDDLFGVMLGRTEWIPIALLAILKAGGAYVPLDPNYPKARNRSILEDAGVKALITERELFTSSGINYEGLETAVIDELQEELQDYPATNPERVGGTNDLFYIIYTSGSTGKPKGVAISHHNIASFLGWAWKEYAEARFDLVYFSTSLCFDMSVFEIFVTLTMGKPLRVMSSGMEIDRWLPYDREVLVNTVPSVVQNLLAIGADLSNVRVLNMAGEPIPYAIKERLEDENMKMVNIYGPSEYTGGTSFYRLTKESKKILIGEPMSNSHVFILDRYLHLVPVGVKGEIYVSGENISRGYLNRPQLTAEKYIDHPFEPGERLYKTGDIGQWDEDGNIELFGRSDNQVKIRGYRIELGEIEAILDQHPGVKQSIVDVRLMSSGQNYLVAYYTGTETELSALRTYIGKLLPSHMVPSYILHLQSFPLTPNGKVDRKKLPTPSEDGEGIFSSYVAPVTETERQLASIWAEVLKKEKVGRTDNFFELGGHSLKATQVMVKIHKLFDVQVTLNSIFEKPQLQDLARHIQACGSSFYEAIPAVEEQEYYPISNAQRRLWVLEQFEEARGVYNIPYSLYYPDLDRASFETALRDLVQRHEILRTVFRSVNGETCQVVKPFNAGDVTISYVDLRNSTNKAGEIRYHRDLDERHLFDFENGPLFFVKLLHLEGNAHRVLIHLHHIIFDGWSKLVLEREFVKIYEAYASGEKITLPALPVQYRDYACWQKHMLSSGGWSDHQDYWRRQLANLPVLELPTDYQRPSHKSYEGFNTAFSLGREWSDKLTKYCESEGATLFMVMVSAINALFYKYTGQDDIVVGTLVSNRDRAELEDQLGFYVNTLALRTSFSGDHSFSELLAEAKKTTLDAYTHQQYPFDVLVDELDFGHGINRSPFFDVLVDVQNFDTKTITEHVPQYDEAFEFSPILIKFDLSFTFIESQQGIIVDVNGSASLFSQQRIERMMRHFVNLLHNVLQSPAQPLSETGFMSAFEKQRILRDFNRAETNTPPALSLVQLFEAKAAQQPAHVVMRSAERDYSYRQLNEQSNRIAHLLLNKYGTRKGDFIGVIMKPGELMIVTLLGIVKAGCAYVPIDVAYPEERAAHIISDAGMKLIIAEKEVPVNIPGSYIYEVLTLSLEETLFSSLPIHNPAREDGADDLFSLLYTSGSTGVPKGVFIRNKGLVNRIDWLWHKYNFGSSDVIYFKTPFVFDVSIGEIFMPLCYGAQLFIGDSNTTDEICTNVAAHRVSYLHFSPTALNNFLDLATPAQISRFQSLRYVFCSGEALLTEIVNKYYTKMNTPLINLYGPTEASIEVSCYETKKGDEIIPIGKPIPNVRLYVLGKNGELMPVGVPGEICIAGVALSTGYLNQEEKTRERFLPDPYGAEGDRLYKTGDIGRWNDKGEVEFLGRRDNQININGTRIELEEIESALLTYNEVVETAVTYRKTENEHYHLIAYYVRRSADARVEEKTASTLTEEQAAFLQSVNSTTVAYEGEPLIHRLFEQAAGSFADQNAIICGNRITTYRSLNEKANRMARYIADRYTINPEKPIGVWMERSADMVATLLAISKLGLTYVPLDTDYPDERIRHILDDAQPSLLVTHSNRNWFEGIAQLHFESVEGELDGYDAKNLPDSESVQPAYIMYTSGSTGLPKGVIVSQASVTDYIHTFTKYFSLSSSDVVLQQASAAFDTFVEETFPTLCSGAQLVILPSGGRDIYALMETAIERQATLLSTTPLVINEINTHEHRSRLSLRALISGGDALKPSYIDALIQQVPIYNTYGPTEATVCATFNQVGNLDECAVIGRPIANHEVYILNEAFEQLGIGASGEIFIGGAGLAQGYLNRDEETGKAFIDHPFRTGQKLYRTGDTGRWLPDGRIQFTGRCDRQVKIRGYRIEPAEVESIITGLDEISGAHVIARDDAAGNKNLVAYFTAASSVSGEQLRQLLNAKMPAYMVPAHLVQVDRFPLTHNGKIDERALPLPAALATDYPFISALKEHLKQKLPFYMVPGMYVEMEKLPLTATGKIDRNSLKKISDLGYSESAYLAPRTDTEKALAAIWESVLKREKIGLSDNLFELGGNSIKATQIVSRIARELNVQVPLGEFFNDPTVEGLAALVRRSTTTEYDHLTTNTIMAQQHYPVSFAQRRLWVIEQFEEAKAAGAYNMPSYFDFDEFDAVAFEKAVNALIERHEILRTSFDMANGEPVQKIWSPEEFGFKVAYTDLRGEEDPRAKARELIEQDAFRPFDLATGPLLRISVLQLSGGSWKVCFNQHHIISDGWSMGVVAKDFNELYESSLLDRPSQLAPLPLQYKDYTLWQKGQLESGQWDEHRNYWHGQLEGELPVMELPSDYPRPMHKRYEGGEVSFMLNRNESQQLQQLCRENGSTMFMCFVALTKILLYRYTGQLDIIAGFPIAGRDRVELEDQLGFYVNTLALRTRFSGNDSFTEVLNKVKEVTLGAYKHQQYPFDLLVDELGLERDMSRTPLFDVMVMCQNYPDAISYEDGISHRNGGVSKFDMTFNFTESGGATEVSIVYSIHQFSEARMRRMALHLKQLMRSVAEEPAAAVKALDYLSSKEKSQFIYDFNGARKPFAANTLHGLIEEQVAKTPEAIAVKFNNQYLTYESLNEYANQFARHLTTNFGVQKQGIVGVMVSRTHLLPVVMLGILKAGAAYVPLDPDYPEARLRFMLEDTSAQAVVTDNTVIANPALAALISDFNVINFDEEFSSLGNYPATNTEPGTTETDLAYLIYTSGTTGRPKGVCLSHRNGAALVNWAKGEYASSVFETVFATTSYCFDLSVYEIFYTLSSGKQLRVLQNALELKKWVYREQDILVNTVPSVVQDLLQQEVDLRSVTVLNIAGEPVPPSVVNGLNLEQIEVRNLYGPSEYATYSTCYRFLPGQTNILIGKPLPNTQVYILDDEQNLLPVGVRGELYVSGDHLSRGYLNRPELTAEKFITHPFDASKKLYRTGDIGVREEDGNINCFGRKDNQVKLRGFRIELGEIESVLGKFEGVEAAIVMIRESADGDKFLVGYYSGRPAAAEEIKQHLSGKLPHYMVPDRLVHIEAFPLSPNGKIDRKKLPDGGVEAITHVVVEAAGAMEEKLLRIWKEVLRRDNFGVTDNFFEIGGQSLKAMQIVSRINTETGASINIKEIFNHATVRKLAALLEGGKQKESLLVYLSQTEVLGPSALFIPPVLGSSTIFRGLAKKLEGRINCYGLQYKGSDNSLEYDNSIRAMAESFAAEIEKLRLQDVVLVGYSMGGLVAFELAKLLEQKKTRVRLVLLDRTLRRDATEAEIDATSEAHLDAIFEGEFKDWLAHADEVSIRSFRKLFRHNLRLISQYEASGKISGSITAVEASKSLRPANMREWEKHAGGPFRHLYADAAHGGLLEEDGLALISELVAERQEELVC